MKKYKFIETFLKNEKLSNSQKEKLLNLVSGELANSDSLEQELIDDVKRIKEKIGLTNQIKKNEKYNPFAKIPNSKDSFSSKLREKVKEVENEKSRDDLTTFPKYVKPSKTQEFLKAYNQDPILSTTCHEIDNMDTINKINNLCQTKKYDFTKHLQRIQNNFESLKKQYFLDPKLINTLLVYLKGKPHKNSNSSNLWSTDGIKFNWGSQELLDWSIKNQNYIPNPGLNIQRQQENRGFTFAGFNSKIKNERISSFSKLVIHFKNLMHIKGDNSMLEMIKNINEYKRWNEKIDFNINHDSFEEHSFKKNIELFTDVDNLKKGYIKIIELAMEAAQQEDSNPIIDLSLKVINKQIYFCIHHLNTVLSKKSADNFEDRIGEKHKLIINDLNGICDLYINADFGYGDYYQVNLWNNRKRKKKPFPPIKGVQHVLIF